MNCPHCGCTIEQPIALVEIETDGFARKCILCGRTPAECGKMVVGVGGCVCVDCVLLSMEMINNPDKYGVADASEQEE